MRTVDFSPFYRSTVGFDHLFSMLDRMSGVEGNGNGFPPYNIERTGELSYRITMAVAGFAQDELFIETKENTLSIRGDHAQKADADASETLYRGIAERNFERRFQLADHVEVKGAKLENGLLHIDLAREIPEALKARSIAIEAAPSARKITKKH